MRLTSKLALLFLGLPVCLLLDSSVAFGLEFIAEKLAARDNFTITPEIAGWYLFAAFVVLAGLARMEAG